MILMGHGNFNERDIDRDSNSKICLQPGLGAQKVEKHWINRRVFHTVNTSLGQQYLITISGLFY
jgi:hypothetical protein